MTFSDPQQSPQPIATKQIKVFTETANSIITKTYRVLDKELDTVTTELLKKELEQSTADA